MLGILQTTNYFIGLLEEKIEKINKGTEIKALLFYTYISPLEATVVRRS